MSSPQPHSLTANGALPFTLHMDYAYQLACLHFINIYYVGTSQARCMRTPIIGLEGMVLFSMQGGTCERHAAATVVPIAVVSVEQLQYHQPGWQPTTCLTANDLNPFEVQHCSSLINLCNWEEGYMSGVRIQVRRSRQCSFPSHVNLLSEST